MRRGPCLVHEDLLPIAEALLARISAELGRPPLRLDEEAIRRIRAARWPGNVRELANALERAAILAEGDTLRGRDLMLPTSTVADTAAGTTGQTMEDIERDAIHRALGEVGGNRRLAAERLGIGVRTLYEKLKRYDID